MAAFEAGIVSKKSATAVATPAATRTLVATSCEDEYEDDACRKIQCISYTQSWNSVPAELQQLWYDSDCRTKLRRTALEKIPEPSHCSSFRRSVQGKISHDSIKGLKDKHKGERCVLIANGPSLNKMRWDWQENFNVVMGMNKVYMGVERYNISKLNYYGACNNLVVDQSRDEIWSGLGQEQPVEKFLRKVPSRFPCSSTRDKNMHFIDNILQKNVFSTDPRYGMHEGHTVTYWSLQVLWWIGCQEVIIIGMDHNFNQTGGPNEKQHMKGPDPNHFDPGYFQGKDWHTADLDMNEHYYRIADKHFREAGRTILDATEGGKCTVFEKVDWRKALY